MGALSQGSAGGLTGMNLKAWVLMTPAGAIVKAFNVSTVVRQAAGYYDVTFATPMANVNYIALLTAEKGEKGFINTKTVNGGDCRTISATDALGLWEFYE